MSAEREGMQQRLAEIRTRLDAATPGAWTFNDRRQEVETGDGAQHICEPGYEFRDNDNFDQDGLFIAHAKADVPWLLELVDRLLQLPGLPPALLGFLGALAEAPHDQAVLCIFGDWLEEQRGVGEAECVRKLVVNAGDALVATLSADYAQDAEWVSTELTRLYPGVQVIVLPDGVTLEPVAAREGDVIVVHIGQDQPFEWQHRMVANLRACFPERTCLLLQNGEDIGAISPEEMRRAGWVRAETKPEPKENL